jgi:hypothetical protein
LKLKDSSAIVSTFDPPIGDAEAIHLMDALWAERRLGRLAELLQAPVVAKSTDASVKEIRIKYAARLSQ